MSNIWITGGKGFIGRHLASYVAEAGNEVFGIGHGLWPIESARKWSYAYWCNGEIDAANLSQLASISGLPDIIFHLAGGSSVGASIQNPREDFKRTVDTTSRLLEWVRHNTIDTRIVGVSSAAVYGAACSDAIAEDVLLEPCSPYGYHKAMMEGLYQLYGENYGLQVALVRLFSVYGAGLKKQLIWDLCCKLAADTTNPARLGGTGNEVRDWLHVSDAARLLWMARGECSPDCGIINGGSGVSTRISEVAAIVCRTWAETASVEFSGSVRKGDPTSLVADIAREQRLGFKPAVDIEDGLVETVRWYKKFLG